MLRQSLGDFKNLTLGGKTAFAVYLLLLLYYITQILSIIIFYDIIRQAVKVSLYDIPTPQT